MMDKKLNLTKEEALEIAKAYKKEHNLWGESYENIDKAVTFYEGFRGLEGAIWLVKAVLKESDEWNPDNEYSYLISDSKKGIEYLIDGHGRTINLFEEKSILDGLTDIERIDYLKDPEKRKLLTADDIYELIEDDNINKFLSKELIEELIKLTEELEEDE